MLFEALKLRSFKVVFFNLLYFFPLFGKISSVTSTDWDPAQNGTFPHAINDASSLSDTIRFNLPGAGGGTINVSGFNTINAGLINSAHTLAITLSNALSGSLYSSSNLTISGPFDVQCTMYVPTLYNLTMTGVNTLANLNMIGSNLFIQGSTTINNLVLSRAGGLYDCPFDVSTSNSLTITQGTVTLNCPLIKYGGGIFTIQDVNPAGAITYDSGGVVVGSNSTAGGVLAFGPAVPYPPTFSLTTPTGATLSQISFTNNTTLASYSTINIDGVGGVIDLSSNVVMNIQTLSSTGTTAYLLKTGAGTLRIKDLYDLPSPPKIYGGVLEFNTQASINTGSVDLYGGTLSLAEQGYYSGNLAFNGPASIYIPGSNVVTWGAQITSVSGGSAVFKKTGPGTLVLDMTNVINSPISIDEGALRLSMQANIAGTSSKPEVILNGGTMNFSNLITLENNFSIPAGKTGILSGANADLMGNISGSGNLWLLSDNFTILPATTNSFSGSVLKQFGFLNVNNNSFPNASIFYMYNGSVLQGYTDVSLSGLISLSGNITFWVGDNGSGTLYNMTLAGNVYSGGTLSKQGTGTLYLTGTNSYSMGTNILDGTIVGNTNSIKGDITLAASGSKVIFNQASSDTFSGNITGPGSFTKTGAGTLTLSGVNSYSGGTNISSGILAGNSTSIQGNITNGGALIFNQSSTGTFSGTIIGSGSFTKNLSGNLNLNGNSSSYAGNISVNGGSLGVNGNYSSANFNVSSAANLYGAGTLKDLTLNGSLTPGNSIGTINIAGDYTQSSSGSLNIEIDPSGICDLVIVSGAANLDGTLNIIQLPGFYPAGTSYTFLTAASIVSDFAVFNTGTVANPVFNKTATVYSLTVDSSGGGGGGGGQFVPPIPNVEIAGNAFEVASALFCDNVTSTGDLQQVKLGLVSLSPQNYLLALSAIAPDELSGITLMEMENQNRVIDLLTNRISRISDKYCSALLDRPKNTLFIAPITFWLNQSSNNSAIGFKGNTTGFGIGWENTFYKDLFLGLTSAYTHGTYRFFAQQGKTTSNSFYLAPYLSTRIDNLYFTAGLLSSYDAIQFDRYIIYPGMSRTGTSNPSTWNISGQLQSKFLIELSKNKYLEPFSQITFSGIYRQSTTESGASSLNFFYPSQWNTTFRTILKCTAGIERCFNEEFSLDSRAGLGYVFNALLTTNNYEADFLVPNQVCFSNLDQSGLQANRNQLLGEVNFVGRFKDRGKSSLDLQYQWGNSMNVASIVLNFELLF